MPALDTVMSVPSDKRDSKVTLNKTITKRAVTISQATALMISRKSTFCFLFPLTTHVHLWICTWANVSDENGNSMEGNSRGSGFMVFLSDAFDVWLIWDGLWCRITWT